MRQAWAALFSKPIRVFLTAAVAASISVAAAAESGAATARYAAIVVDASTGKTLYSQSADEPRFPASLTKMMTLYLTFEALSAGRLSLQSQGPFSALAAAEPPTKLGVKAGNSITVETAIYSLVTKSANDSAAALGELLGGSRQNFARMMTAKARSLGMTGTTFQNANGLPDPNQRTTARDMATLGMALRDKFPRYYRYFSTRSFTYNNRRIANHNRLLGRIKGVDGIKTGYTRASGFNLVSSVSDGDRRIVAVIMGGASGGSRDAKMADLIRQYLPKASSQGGTPPLVAPIAAIAQAILPKRNPPMPDRRPKAEVVVATDEDQVIAAEEAQIAAQPPVEEVVETSSEPVMQAYAEPMRRPKAAIDGLKAAAGQPSGWAIQVASSPSEKEARGFLATAARKVPGAVSQASPFTVPFEKNGTTFYRARFGGYATKTAAWNACGALKKKHISCYAIEQ